MKDKFSSVSFRVDATKPDRFEVCLDPADLTALIAHLQQFADIKPSALANNRVCIIFHGQLLDFDFP